MSNEQEHNQNSAEESMLQGPARDERIAPQAPRGQELGTLSSVNSDEPVGHMRHVVLVTLAVLVLLAACTCGVFACTVGAQDPMPIEAGQQAGSAEDGTAPTENGAAGESADADAADEKDAVAGKNAKGKKSAKGKNKASTKNGKNGKNAKTSKNKSASDKASGSQASDSEKESGSASDGSSSKNNGGSGSGSGGNSGKHNSTASNKITVTMSIDGSRAGDQDSASAAARKITVKKGSNVYDVLVASGVSIQGDATYVRSISGLAEFQCGGGSGWMYSVDGVFPNVSCGKYTLTGGERIVWAYTLNLGEDVK